MTIKHRVRVSVLGGGALIALSLLTLLPISPSVAANAAESAVLTTPVLSARRLPAVLLGAVADPKFSANVDAYMNGMAGTTCALISQNGRVIYSRGATEALAPASTVKLLTATAAIEVLGADTRLRTTVVAGAAAADGIIEGDLFVVGGGDPLLVTSGYKQSLEDPDQLTEDFGDLADAVATAGIREIRGSVLGDDSRHDRTRWLPSWPTRYQIGGVVAPLSALMVNDGQTGFADEPDRANANRRAGDPPALAAATLRTLLERRGVLVTGGSGVGTAPQDSEEIAGIDSPPIRDIVGEMLTDSDNTTAELLTREMGLRTAGQGTTQAGVAAIIDVLESAQLPLDGLVLADGSGLDLGSRVSCPLLVAALNRLPADGDIVSRLAVSGRTGTLRKRLQGTSTVGKIRAKTGTLNSVNSLVGLADTKFGSKITFSMIENGTDPRGSSVTDGFAERMVTFGEGPKLSALEPLPIR